MKHQIINVSGHQTSKVIAIFYVIFTIPLMLIGIMTIIFGGTPENENEQNMQIFNAIFMAFAPIIYGVLGYVFMRLGC